MHTIAILALDGVIAFDLSMPLEVFGRTRLPDGQPAYEVCICAPSAEVDAGTFMLRVPRGLDLLAEADTIILPGLAVPISPLPDEVMLALHNAAARGARIASICAGAFLLAETGLLDGLRATTHWAAADALARRYPRIKVDPNVLFVDNGQFLTSAGAAAGFDLCLHMIRLDYGAAVAADAARVSVMPLERDGGQAQFIVYEPPAPDGITLEPVLRWMEAHCHLDLKLEDIAAQAMMSTRTLSRRFREQTGTTPLQWLKRARVYRAQTLLETTDHPIEWIGCQVGFGSATHFRDQFKRLVGISPQAYRHAFRGTAALR
ncbi:transcriptional regulator GlxA family with amidase domain [Thermosporothrix hazakensis]|jgi:transcriptional regulator GlxA family with amidase domain|uniref:Transcriptional regulator GlxA family with amidase domain n=1 Tax=Thermosporothrix hazakensis TaxID=644383 RepID=A0A326U274_THEHA|nr:helix-turn-helix domain-containing protein [Thermosporothrix hazakensis]PZW24087.1 transcriptional regulator GlxA family with amidase domain [Thermosporothrix hazakensis]GCE50300.1 AraC family transcriptional regulator [Thermosporothrix hazakensis]